MPVRIGDDLLKFIIKQNDPKFCQGVKIPQDLCHFFFLKPDAHIPSNQNTSGRKLPEDIVCLFNSMIVYYL